MNDKREGQMAFDDIARKAWQEFTRHREMPPGILPDKVTDVINRERDQLNTYELFRALNQKWM